MGIESIRFVFHRIFPDKMLHTTLQQRHLVAPVGTLYSLGQGGVTGAHDFSLGLRFGVTKNHFLYL